MTEPGDSYLATREQAKRDILAAYGVTAEEVEALDAALGGPELRERERRFRAALPGRIAEITAELSERYKNVLPEGWRFEYVTSSPKPPPEEWLPLLDDPERSMRSALLAEWDWANGDD